MWPAAITYALANAEQRDAVNRTRGADRHSRSRVTRKRRWRFAGDDGVR